MEYKFDCDRCRRIYNFDGFCADTGLLPGNIFAWELYQLMNSAFVRQFELEAEIWKEYREEMNEEGFSQTFNKLDLIASLIAENTKDQSGTTPKQEKQLQKEFKK